MIDKFLKKYNNIKGWRKIDNMDLLCSVALEGYMVLLDKHIDLVDRVLKRFEVVSWSFDKGYWRKFHSTGKQGL